MAGKKIVNHITKHGKKGTGEKIWKDTLKKIQKTSPKSIKSIIQIALINAAPTFKIHRISSGKTKKQKKIDIKEVPVFIKKYNVRMSMSIKNILSASKRNGVNTSTELAKNIMLTAQNKGLVIKKKKTVQEKVLTSKKYFRFYRW